MDTVNKILFFLVDNWEAVSGLLLLIYGFIARKSATAKDITIVGNLKKILDYVVKNKRKPSVEDAVVPSDPSKNVVVVKRDEHI